MLSSNSASLQPAASFDRAWWLVLGAGICMLCGQPAVALYTFGVFVPEILADTGWSAATVAAAVGPGALIASLMAPFIGVLTDRLGVKRLALIGAPTFAAGLILVGLAPFSATSFAICVALMWLLGFAGSPILYAQMLTGWFDARRGLVIGIMFSFGAIGIAVWPPIAALFIASFGWRYAYVLMGIIAGSVIFISAIFFLKDAPRAVRQMRFGERGGQSVKEALGTPRFWKISFSFMLLTAVLAGVAVNFPIIVRQRGVDAQTASLIMSVIGISMFLARLLIGFLLDRFFAVYVTAAMTLLPLVAFLIMSLSASDYALIVSAALIGFGLGGEFDAAAYLTSRAFGVRSFGAIYGLVTLACGLGGAIGPAAISAYLVTSKSTEGVFLVGISGLVCALLVLLLLKRSDLSFQTAE